MRSVAIRGRGFLVGALLCCILMAGTAQAVLVAPHALFIDHQKRSGVFYVQLPDVVQDPVAEPQGWLEFGRPTADLHVRSEPETQVYRPQYGNIILFPSYFYHGTIPFKSRERRICISFDVEPIYI